MSVTIKDIARIANVSHTTVSRALNDSPYINRETKEKIKEIATELNYVPNYSAKSLVLNKSFNIGLFLSTLYEGTSPNFFYEAVIGVNSIIKDSYNLVTKGIDDYKDFNSITKKSFDGIILMSQSVNDNPFLYNVMEKGIPIVVLNREIEDCSIVNILSDDRHGAFKAVNYLISQGHRDIAIIEGKKGFKSTEERTNGYIDALEQNNIPINRNYFIEGNYESEGGYAAMKKFLGFNKVPTAVFCSSDDMAVGAIKAVTEHGLNIPKDISVVGFDDNMFASFLSPALTTIRRPIMSISQEGARSLLRLINSEPIDEKKKFLKTELVIRESVASIGDNIK